MSIVAGSAGARPRGGIGVFGLAVGSGGIGSGGLTWRTGDLGQAVGAFGAAVANLRSHLVRIEDND